MKHILALGLFILLTLNINGQSQNVDSLVNVLNTEKLTVSEQSKLYYEITVSYGSLGNFSKAIEYAQSGLVIALRIDDKSLAANLNECIGISYYSIGDYEKSYPYLEDAISLAIQSNDKKAEMTAHLSTGAYYGRLGKYEDALKHFIEALSISESIGDKKQNMNVLGNIGVIYITLDPDKAVPYFVKVIELADELNMPRAKIMPFHELSRYYTKKKELEKALEYAQKATELSRKYSSAIYEALSLGQLAQIHSDMGNYDKALGYLNESIPVCEKTNDPIILANTWKTMSDIYLKQERYKECEQAASKAWGLDSTGLAIKSELLFNMAYSNTLLKNSEKAETYLMAYRKAMEEKSDKNFHEALTDTEAKYETEKKELRISSLEKERQLYVWLGIAGVLLVLSLGIALWFKIRNSQKEKQLAASNAVQEGEMGERKRIAGELHDRLLGSLSAVKSDINDTDVRDKLNGCIEEVRRISRDLMPLALRFGIKTALEDFTAQFPNVRFHFFGQEKRIEKRLEFVVYCCANELVTNSIRHSGAKNINVQLVQGESYIALTVQDDGCGFDEKTVAKGVGLKSVQDRVASCSGKMNIFSSPNKGTETVIEINL